MHFSRIRIRPNIRVSSNLHRLIQGNIDSPHQLLWDLFPRHKKRTFLYREEIAKEQVPMETGIRGEPIYYMVSNGRPQDQTPLFSVESKEYSPKVESGDRLAFKLRANPVVTRKQEGKKNSVRHDVVMDAQRELMVTLSGSAEIGMVPKKSDMKKSILKALKESGNGKLMKKIHDVIESNEKFEGMSRKASSPSKLLALALKAHCDRSLENWFAAKGKKNGFQLMREEKSGRLKFQAESYRWHALPRKGKAAGFSSVDFDGEIEVLDPNKFIPALFNGIGPAKAFGCGLMLVRRI